MTVTHGPVVIRRRLGHVLKQLRVARDLQLSQVARQLEVSASKLSRIETGQVEPKFRDVRDLLDIYEATPEDRDRLMGWANEAKSPGWWQPFTSHVHVSDLDLYISLEAEARSVQIFSTPISGLLQTEAYARLILSGAVPSATTAELERLVEVRVGRQAVVAPARADAPPLELHAVLDEVALHRISDREVMREQVSELLRRSEQPNITLQVLPFSAGYTRATSTFVIFEPRETATDWTVVNVESTGSDAYFDAPGEIANYRAVWHHVLAYCLSPEETRTMLDGLRRG